VRFWRIRARLGGGKGGAEPPKLVNVLLYGVRSPGPGSDIVGDVVEWFETRAEAEQFIAEVACEPNPRTR
jgi:hypothetical protein